MAGIFWLASYPKSGNTWLRIFLTNYLQNGDQPADINHLDGGPIASAREIFDDLVGVEASDLTLQEQELLRPQVYLQFAQELAQDEFLKVHDAYTLNSSGQPLFPPEASRGVIYIMRNPLSVAPSLANHINKSIDEAITMLNNEQPGENKRLAGLGPQLPQRWLGWGEHVRSWSAPPGQRTLLVRYEDLKRQPFEAFRAIIRFSGLDDDEARIRKAIQFSSFEQVKKQEAEKGFRERIRPTSFFRKGETAAWKSELTPEQIERILAFQAEIMRRYGYLDNAGIPAEAIPLEEFSYD
ncbi:MAG: sulfotransferase [Chloroflexi bacterium HGW-Chloroflexi-6]|nr:MAG: sulfotransferase [Chloroflexi bacterium HGW-Chloroflexi-6]